MAIRISNTGNSNISQRHFHTQKLPSSSPSPHAAKTKTIVITTFANCILVIPAPVLWINMRQLQVVQLSECQ